MAIGDSVSRWIEELKSGRSSAAGRLFAYCYAPLARFAARRLGNARRVVDEDDVVNSAFHSFFARALRGDFPDLQHRSGLWPLLTTIIARKASNHRRTLLRSQKRDHELETIRSRLDNDPLAVVLIADALDGLLRDGDKELRQIALDKLQGYSNAEIAARIGRSVPTVERRLRLIRGKWEREST